MMNEYKEKEHDGTSTEECAQFVQINQTIVNVLISE